MSQPPGTFQARQCAPDSHPDCRVFPSRSPRYTLPRPIAQDAGHRQLRIVVEDRLRYAAEEAECGVVPVAKRFGGFRRIGLHKAGVAMRQVDGKEVDLALYPGNLRHRLAKVRLRMAGIMPQRYEDLELPQSARQHVVLNNGDPAGIAVLVAKPLEDPLRGMPLLPRPALILRQDTVDDPGERIQLRTRRRPAPPVPGRYREHQHLGYCPRVNPKLSRRFPSAQTLDLYRVTNPPIKLHHFHPPPSAITPKGYLLPESYSGATGLTGRFNEGFLLRRLQHAHGGKLLLHTRRSVCLLKLFDPGRDVERPNGRERDCSAAIWVGKRDNQDGNPGAHCLAWNVPGG